MPETAAGITEPEDDLERAFDDWDEGAEEGGNGSTNPPEETLASEWEDAETLAKRIRTDIEPTSLLQLPKEMLLRIMGLLPASALLLSSRTSHTLLTLASEDILWRRLYIARWGKTTASQVRSGTEWKRAYLDADAEEWDTTVRGAGDSGPDGSSSGSGSDCGPGASSDGSSGFGGGFGGVSVGAMFLQMLRAKRDTAPDRRTLDFPLPADPANIEAKVAAWRRSRGFLDPGPGSGGGGGSGAAGASSSAEGASGSGAGASSGAALAGSLQRPDLSRPNLSKRGRAGAAAVTFTRINPGEKPPVYACDQTGWVHVCGDACTEGLVDAGSELLVCPVSGQTTDRLVHECEEEGEGDCARGPGEEDALGFIGGGFGAFFMAGYECRDEKALNRLLGYKAL